MLVTVESCTRELKRTNDGRDYTGLKINGQWINVPGDHRDKYKKQIDLEVKGNWGKIAQPALANNLPANAATSAQGSQRLQEIYSNGKGNLNQWQMAEAFDHWWEKVNATGLADDAKATIMCTLLIATADGRVKFEEIEEDAPPPGDDDIPF
jgi:hypothetical protein